MTQQRQVRRHSESVLQASFEHPASGARISAAVWDASLGGLFIETDSPLEEGALTTLDIRTPESTISVDTRVLWARPSKLGDDQPAGMAVRFIDLPDEVSVALGRVLQSTMQEKTILGVGGATKEPTQPGIAAPAGAPTPRETQIGVAPPANAPAKPRLVLSDTSLPNAPAAPEKPLDPGRLEETSPSRARLSSAESRSSTAKGGGFGRLVLFMIIGGAAAGAYLYRAQLAELLVPTPPSTSSASAPTTPTTKPSEAPMPSAREPAFPQPSTTAVITERDGGIQDAGAHDAGGHDAGRLDAGGHDAGRLDAGAPRAHDAGAGSKAAAPKASAKHPSTPDVY